MRRVSSIYIFFKVESSLLFLNTLKGQFICGYDIPYGILAKHKGVGQYRNFINFIGITESF